jgi:hypothetical protein
MPCKAKIPSTRAGTTNRNEAKRAASAIFLPRSLRLRHNQLLAKKSTKGINRNAQSRPVILIILSLLPAPGAQKARSDNQKPEPNTGPQMRLVATSFAFRSPNMTFGIIPNASVGPKMKANRKVDRRMPNGMKPSWTAQVLFNAIDPERTSRSFTKCLAFCDPKG